MSNPESDIRTMLEADESNVSSSLTLLGHYEILEMYDRLTPLYDELDKEIQKHVTSSSSFPFARTDASGNQVLAWDLILRLYMSMSAYQEFLIAGGHLFRGQISQSYGHIRRAIEGAGIAYLSKTKPEIGDYFRNNDRKKFRNETTTKKILPSDDPLTAQLYNSVDMASSQVHNNFTSFASRLKESFKVEGTRYDFKYALSIHDVDQDSLGYFLNICLWNLRMAERVFLLLAASFDLPKGAWHQSHEKFRSDLDRLYAELKDVILGEE